MPIPRRRAPLETRAALIDAAFDVIVDHSTADFTLDAVAARAGVSKGALLHHFPSKTALIEALFDVTADAFIADVRAQAAQDHRREGRFSRAYLVVTLRMSAEDAKLGRVLLAASLMEPALVGGWARRLAALEEDEPVGGAAADDALLQRLVADGLWLREVDGTLRVPAETRRALASILGVGESCPLPEFVEPVP
ncbi:MAG: TetR/AcrR family transcriptional regulator [Pseudomonadota bacterium]